MGVGRNFSVVPVWFKRAVAIGGLILAVPGGIVAMGLLCLSLVLSLNGDAGAVYAGLLGFTLIGLAAGAGGVAFWLGLASLKGKNSGRFRLPPLAALAGIFGLSFGVSGVIYRSDFLVGLLLPPMLVVVVTVPSLMAVVWFSERHMDHLTWRRGILAFSGAAAAGFAALVLLQILSLGTVSLLDSNPIRTLSDVWDAVFEGLVRRRGLTMMLEQRFGYTFSLVTLIIPLVGTLTKPLVTLPWVGQLSRRETFLLGAVAGAGFATVENMLLLGFELRIWSWIGLVQALGGAVHPLGSGLVAMGWREVVRGKRDGWPLWWASVGVAVSLHSLWNLGFLWLIFGNSPPLAGGFRAVSLLLGGVSTGLLLLLVAGFAVGLPWIGRSIGRHLALAPEGATPEATLGRLTGFDGAVAVWALASLMALMAAGLVWFQALAW